MEPAPAPALLAVDLATAVKVQAAGASRVASRSDGPRKRKATACGPRCAGAARCRPRPGAGPRWQSGSSPPKSNGVSGWPPPILPAAPPGAGDLSSQPARTLTPKGGDQAQHRGRVHGRAQQPSQPGQGPAG